LEVEGYEVAVQYDGEQALKWLAINDPDLIIMDCMLPKFGGLSVMEALNKNKPGGYKKPVIMVSGLDREEYKLKSRELGAVAYLVKSSASISEMVDIVKESLKNGVSKIRNMQTRKAF
jgi:two-component system response regulator VicR